MNNGDNGNSGVKTAERPQTKRPYSKPRLEVYGSLAELCQGSGENAGDSLKSRIQRIFGQAFRECYSLDQKTARGTPTVRFNAELFRKLFANLDHVADSVKRT